MQVYMSYLINFVERTLGMTDYVMPLAVIIVCSAVLAGVLGFLMDKFGRKHFFIPLVAAAVIGTLGIYLLKFLGTSDTAALLGMLIPVGIVTMTAELSVSGLFVSSFRDYIPKGKEGCFQGIRMFLFVLLPMIIGPAIGNAIIDRYGWYTFSETMGEDMRRGRACLPSVTRKRKRPPPTKCTKTKLKATFPHNKRGDQTDNKRHGERGAPRARSVRVPEMR